MFRLGLELSKHFFLISEHSNQFHNFTSKFRLKLKRFVGYTDYIARRASIFLLNSSIHDTNVSCSVFHSLSNILKIGNCTSVQSKVGGFIMS